MEDFFIFLMHFDMGLENFAMAEWLGWDDIAKMVFLDCDMKRIKEQAAKEAEEKDC